MHGVLSEYVPIYKSWLLNRIGARRSYCMIDRLRLSGKPDQWSSMRYVLLLRGGIKTANDGISFSSVSHPTFIHPFHLHSLQPTATVPPSRISLLTLYLPYPRPVQLSSFPRHPGQPMKISLSSSQHSISTNPPSPQTLTSRNYW